LSSEDLLLDLNPQETTLLNAFRRLPADAANQLSALVQRLVVLSGHTTIDWSDSWTDDDLRDFTAHSLKRIEADEEH